MGRPCVRRRSPNTARSPIGREVVALRKEALSRNKGCPQRQKKQERIVVDPAWKDDVVARLQNTAAEIIGPFRYRRITHAPLHWRERVNAVIGVH